ncbi:MAG: ATP-binding cassette domain-containing protein [Pseudomonadota bacterium]|nr:ATP-binding cassette domain-containing protein [Pseudomonadota bacterium]
MADELVATGLRIVAGAHTLVHDATFRVGAGEIVALVGASGSGKTVTARALLGMLPFSPGCVAGTLAVTVNGATSTPRTEAEFRPLRGGAIGLLWQDARAALDPLRTVGAQVSAAATLAGAPAAPDTALARAGFGDPSRVARLYPHALSGGMAQRAAIAVALARNSRFLVADEPTTGLDPSVQRAILGQLRLLADAGVGLLFITHDLRLLPGFATRVLVMDAGRIVEEAASTAGLLGAGRALVEATRKVAGGAL